MVGPDRVNPELVTPELTQDIIQDHFDRKIAPVVLYPEVVSGNPLRAPLVVRYFANFPGLLGGDATPNPDDIKFAYSEVLAQAVGVPGNVLQIPIVDTQIFQPLPPASRTETCFYAGRFKSLHGGVPFGLPADCIEIFSAPPQAQSQAEIAELFRRSKRFYCFENTALSLEAALCGCPTVLMPNEYFSEPISRAEFGLEGMAWGDSPEEIERAERTVGRVCGIYQESCERFFDQLETFVAVAQQAASARSYDTIIQQEWLLLQRTGPYATVPTPSGDDATLPPISAAPHTADCVEAVAGIQALSVSRLVGLIGLFLHAARAIFRRINGKIIIRT
jgi:hypothetical protein